MPLTSGSRPDSSEKLFLRDEGRRGHASSLPPDLLAQSARRLRILCLLYAFVFFMSAYFPLIFMPEMWGPVFRAPDQWVPGVIAIAVALGVAAIASSPRISPSAVVRIGLIFEVVSSYGIAASEYLGRTASDLNGPSLGLSWVAVWVLLYAVVVPNTPWRTALATLASVTSVPVVLGHVAAKAHVPITPGMFFLGLIFPYLLVALMSYVGAQVIYSLGREVARAREMGGYRLVEKLGAGGMGEVWRAQHQLLARPAAIKLVRPEILGAAVGARRGEVQERFSREAQATAMMRSPHTVELYDFGLANDGTFYYVMELLDGFNLQILVERFGPVAPERAIRLLRQVCHSLAEAHGQHLIHRDIKPANVFVCRYGRELDFVKVLDFGMVKSRSGGDAAETQLTADHSVFGTPAFMAPEQVLGGPVDARADLYAVGCLAYWLLTGQLVFEGRTGMEIMMRHTQAEPAPPSSRSELPIPPALDQLVLACLAKRPSDRPPSADALAEALRAIEVPSPWTPERARAWWEQHHPARAWDLPAAGERPATA